MSLQTHPVLLHWLSSRHKFDPLSSPLLSARYLSSVILLLCMYPRPSINSLRGYSVLFD